MTDAKGSGNSPAGLIRLLWLHAETFIHVGSGMGTELIDLPFARESVTDYPYIPGSGMKGALRDAARRKYDFPELKNGKAEPDPRDGAVVRYFGSDQGEGAILVSDARLAFLPLRSLDKAFRYVTCPYLLQRMARDIAFANPAMELMELDSLQRDLVGFSLKNCEAVFLPERPDRDLFLEEFRFKPVVDNKHQEGVNLVTKFFRMGDAIESLVNNQLAVISDEWFAYFARHGLHVRMRNALDSALKTVIGGALWSEESLPPETLLYIVLLDRPGSHAPQLRSFLNDIGGAEIRGYLQVGGNETVGEGWFRVLGLPKASTDISKSGDAGEQGEAAQKENLGAD